MDFGKELQPCGGGTYRSFITPPLDSHTPLSNLALGRQVTEALRKLGVARLGDFSAVSRTDLRCCRAIGPVTLERILAALSNAGVRLRNDDSSSTQPPTRARKRTPLSLKAIDDLQPFLGQSVAAALKLQGINTLHELQVLAVRAVAERVPAIDAAASAKLAELLFPTSRPDRPASALPPSPGPSHRAGAATGDGKLLQPTLNEKEVLCMHWTMEGKTAWEVGSILGFSERTAHAHLNKAMHKLGCANKYQAACTAQRLGLIR